MSFQELRATCKHNALENSTAEISSYTPPMHINLRINRKHDQCIKVAN